MRILYAARLASGANAFIAPQVRMLETSSALRARGHEVRVLNLSENSVIDYSRDLRYSDLVLMREAPFWIRDVVLAWFLRKPIVIEFHGLIVNELHRQGANPLRVAQARCCQALSLMMCSACVTTCQAYEHDLARSYPGLWKPSEVIVNGVDTRCFHMGRDDDARSALGYAHDDVVLGFFGSVSNNYDFEPLLELLVRHEVDPALQFLVVGGGPKLAALVALVQELGLENRVTILPAVPHAEVGRLLRVIDLCFLPLNVRLLSENQGVFSMKLAEYLASGRPLVAQDYPGSFTHGPLRDFTFSFDTREPERSLQTALQRALELRPMWAELGARARHFAETHLSREVLGERLEKLLLGTLDEHRSKRYGRCLPF